jgi:hypothetical protein
VAVCLVDGKGRIVDAPTAIHDSLGTAEKSYARTDVERAIIELFWSISGLQRCSRQPADAAAGRLKRPRLRLGVSANEGNV